MRIVILGAGNLATNITKALKRAGHDIVQVYSRTMQSASVLANVVGCEAINDLSLVSPDADVYIIAVRDTAISDVARAICPIVSMRATILHTAGSVPMEVLLTGDRNVCRGVPSQSTTRVRPYGVLYPMQTFTKGREVNFAEIPCFIEGSDAQALKMISLLARSISDNVREMSSEDRKYLHLAAVYACNFVNHCYELSSEVLERCGIPFDIMLPLIDETARKVHSITPAEAQTGPAVRYDRNVMDAHLRLLKDDQRMSDIYKLMSNSIYRKIKND